MSEQADKPDIGWAILEVMGHRRLGGYVSEQEIAGGALLRIDIPCEPPATQLYSTGAVYCITPTSEDMARAVARRSNVEPVHRWELPPAATAEPPDEFERDRDDDDEPADAEEVW